MRVIVAGCRHITDYTRVKSACEESQFVFSSVVSGKARGVDTLGEQYASEIGVPVVPFPADWKTFPRRAGFIRNKAMAEYADALVAVWDCKSAGTRDMIHQARLMGLKIHISYI